MPLCERRYRAAGDALSAGLAPRRRAAAATRPAPAGASAPAARTRRSTPPAWGPGTPRAFRNARSNPRSCAPRSHMDIRPLRPGRKFGAERTVSGPVMPSGARVAGVVERCPRVPAELVPQPALALEGGAVRVRHARTRTPGIRTRPSWARAGPCEALATFRVRPTQAAVVSVLRCRRDAAQQEDRGPSDRRPRRRSRCEESWNGPSTPAQASP